MQRCLAGLSKEEADSIRTQLAKSLFPVNPDSYLISTIPGRIKNELLKLPASGQEVFAELINGKSEKYLINSFNMSLAQYSTDKWRKEIKEMTANHLSYYTIAIKMLYDNATYKDYIERTVNKTASMVGRRFDDLLVGGESMKFLLSEEREL